jgi:hypothetical protein
MLRTRWLRVALPVVLVGIVVAILFATAGPDSLEMVQGWTSSRNAGDVDLAMSYLADDARVFGFSMATPREEA